MLGISVSVPLEPPRPFTCIRIPRAGRAAQPQNSESYDTQRRAPVRTARAAHGYTNRNAAIARAGRQNHHEPPTPPALAHLTNDDAPTRPERARHHVPRAPFEHPRTNRHAPPAPSERARHRKPRAIFGPCSNAHTSAKTMRARDKNALHHNSSRNENLLSQTFGNHPDNTRERGRKTANYAARRSGVNNLSALREYR